MNPERTAGLRYVVEYQMTNPKRAIGICLLEGSKFIRTVLVVHEPSHEKNYECEVACAALNATSSFEETEIMTEYERGFNDAIDKVLNLCSEEGIRYVELDADCVKKEWEKNHENLIDFNPSKEFRYKALAILDFKLFLITVFRNGVVAGEGEMTK